MRVVLHKKEEAQQLLIKNLCVQESYSMMNKYSINWEYAAFSLKPEACSLQPSLNIPHSTPSPFRNKNILLFPGCYRCIPHPVFQTGIMHQ